MCVHLRIIAHIVCVHLRIIAHIVCVLGLWSAEHAVNGEGAMGHLELSHISATCPGVYICSGSRTRHAIPAGGQDEYITCHNVGISTYKTVNAVCAV